MIVKIRTVCSTKPFHPTEMYLLTNFFIKYKPIDQNESRKIVLDSYFEGCPRDVITVMILIKSTYTQRLVKIYNRLH